MREWEAVAASIADSTRRAFRAATVREAGGGGSSINRAYRVQDGDRVYFVKLNRCGSLAMFEAEAAGLRALAECGALRVPAAICTGECEQWSWLVLEHLHLRAGGERDMAALGAGLARQHTCTADQFGWHRDNTIGATPQHNAWAGDWVAFWRERRLAVQLRLAARNGYAGALHEAGEALLARLPDLLDGHAVRPSLLHGDLWGGNAAFTQEGEPVLYDPACYFGDREADLAMTELFGGFTRSFYAAYAQAAPLDAGYEVRRDLYNLYHVLNHLNLFGGGYLQQARRVVDRLLSEVR